MFQTILVAIDGGPSGEDARALAALLAASSASTTAVHVAAGEDAGPSGVDRTVEGPFGSAIADLVAELGCDLVVVGAHHRSHVWSVNHVRSTLRAVRCSVAVAPRGFAQEAPRGIAVVGVAYDEGPESRAALEAARAVAAPRGARLEVIEVVSESNLVDATRKAGWRAEDAERRLTVVDGATVRVLEGDARTRLRQAADTVDLLVVGERHPDLLGRITGATGDRLIQDLACPLLLHHG